METEGKPYKSTPKAIESEFRLTQNADDSRVEALYSVFAARIWNW